METFLTSVFPWIIFGFMLLSVVSSVVPVFPGGVVIWVLALLFGIFHPAHFAGVGGWMFAIVTLLMFGSTAADNVLMGAKAKEAGASWTGIIVALVAGFISAFFLTPIGGLVVASLSLFLVEYIRLQDSEEAVRITKGLVLGCGWSVMVRMVIAILQVGAWCIWAF